MANQAKKNAPEKPEPAPNLIFVGIEKGYKPIKSFVDNPDKIILPDAEMQVETVKKGDIEISAAIPFYHEQAERIVRVLGTRLYKFHNPEKK